MAQGTYKPDRGIGNLGTGNRWSTFGLQNNTEIYGGFAGGELTPWPSGGTLEFGGWELRRGARVGHV